MMNSEEGVRILPSNHYGGEVEASRIELKDDTRHPGTFGWLTRFTVVTAGETAKKWSTINALYVDGIIDGQGNWQADFPEPTLDHPTHF